MVPYLALYLVKSIHWTLNKFSFCKELNRKHVQSLVNGLFQLSLSIVFIAQAQEIDHFLSGRGWDSSTWFVQGYS